MEHLDEIYTIFKCKAVFQGGYMRFLKSDLKKELMSGNFIYKNGVYLSWYERKNFFKIKKFVSLHEGAGYGREVFMEALERFREKDIFLKVKKDNERAIKFYELNNFFCVSGDDKYLQYIRRKDFLLV